MIRRLHHIKENKLCHSVTYKPVSTIYRAASTFERIHVISVSVVGNALLPFGSVASALFSVVPVLSFFTV